MARNRVIYQSEALFAGQKSTASTITATHTTEEIRQLHRVQSAKKTSVQQWSASYSRETHNCKNGSPHLRLHLTKVTKIQKSNQS